MTSKNLKKLIENTIDKKLREAEKTSTIRVRGKLQTKVNKLAELSDLIDQQKAKLKELKNEFNPLQHEIVELLEGMDKTKKNILMTNKYLVSIKRQPSSRINKSYKEGYEYLLNKVNKKIQNLAAKLVKDTEKIVKVSGTLAVQHIKNMKEDSLFSKLINVGKKLVSKVSSYLQKDNKEIENLLNKIGKIINK